MQILVTRFAELFNFKCSVGLVNAFYTQQLLQHHKIEKASLFLI